MVENTCNLTKYPSVTLKTYAGDRYEDIKPQNSTNVHRSVSLQSQRKPDRNNNSTSPGGASSHFELANLLARAPILDAKFLRQLNEYETSEKKRQLSASDNTLHLADRAGAGLIGSPRTPGCLVHLPDRYLHATSTSAAAPSSRRRTSGVRRASSNASTMQKTATCTLDVVPECQLTSPSSVNDVTDSEMRIQREYDALVAMKWLRQEIRQLKQSDRTLMRKLFELGTVIHQLSGGLYETVSCQTVTENDTPSPTSQQSSLTSALKWRPHVESDDCIQSSVAQQKIVQQEQPAESPPIDAFDRAVSMIDMRPPTETSDDDDSKLPNKSKSLNNMTSRASRLFARLLTKTGRTASTDQIPE